MTTREKLGKPARLRVDLTIAQGEDKRFSFKWGTRDTPTDPVVGYDLTGWTARAQFRTRVGSPVWVTLTSEDDEIILNDPDDGRVTVILSHEVTETTAWNAYRTGVWDLELVNPAGEVTRLLEGTVKVKHDVTRV